MVVAVVVVVVGRGISPLSVLRILVLPEGLLFKEEETDFFALERFTMRPGVSTSIKIINVRK